MVKDCEEIDFPQIRHDFSDTKIYWRKTSETKDLKDLKELNLDSEPSPSLPSESGN